MDKYNIQYSKESVDDLRNIYAYICFNLSSPNNAVKKIEKIKKAVRTLDTVNATPFCLNTATLDCQ